MSILLDAMMPGMDGFEVARPPEGGFRPPQHIPIVFMTGLTETEHVVTAFGCGRGRLRHQAHPAGPRSWPASPAHMQNARQMKQARTALDAFGQATVAVRAADARLVWQTPLARKLLHAYFRQSRGSGAAGVARLDRRCPPGSRRGPGAGQSAHRRRRGGACLPPSTIKPGDDEWLVVLREENDASAVEALMAAFRLTNREAEVLYWVSLGKTSKDIGDILGSSPRTVNKHLEHVFEKLGVETRTAAANLAVGKIRAGLPRGGE